jgi:phospholipid/cholesterol/gamma-HCH transport system ATP-binding protein
LNTPASIVDISNLYYSIGGRPVFEGLNMQFIRGKVTAVMGPSGTGKTTLLRLITGQSRPDSGSVIVAGENIAQLRRSELYDLRRRMGMLFQNGALLTDINVFENVAFPLREHTDLPERLIRQIVLTKLQAVGLRGAANLMPSELSGGMNRRVALARAIVMDPEILIYDEPFVGLDPISLGVILRLIRRLNDVLRISSIVVSHDVQEIASVADQVFLLSGGGVVASGTPQDLRSNPSQVVKQFVGGLEEGPVEFHFPAKDYFEQLLARSSNS